METFDDSKICLIFISVDLPVMLLVLLLMLLAFFVCRGIFMAHAIGDGL
jgi:hypothetical protein